MHFFMLLLFCIAPEQGLRALIKKPDSGIVPKNWREGGYFDKAKLPKDPWGREFKYRCPSEKGDFEMYTYGADGVLGGKGINEDIFNWQLE